MKITDGRTYNFTSLFRDLNKVNEFLQVANKPTLKIEFGSADKYGEYEESESFNNYSDFAKFIKETYNSSKEILSAEFVIGEPFLVTWFEDSYKYLVNIIG